MLVAVLTVIALACIAGFAFGLAASYAFKLPRREGPERPSARVLNLRAEREARAERWVAQQDIIAGARRRK